MPRFPWQRQDMLTVGTYGPPFLNLPIRMSLKKAKTHWHIIGTSGSGKSRFLAGLFLAMYTKGIPTTIIDPHGDLARLILSHLVAQGVYKNEKAFENIIYLDIPAAEANHLYLPFNPLNQELPEHTNAENFKNAMHRAFPELAQGAAIFDTLLPRVLRVLIANNLPITAIEPFFYNDAFREKLLERCENPIIKMYFTDAFGAMRKNDQLAYAGSVLRRAAQLTDLPVLFYSFGQKENVLPFRTIMDEGKSLIVNLKLADEDASRLFGCMIMVGFEQAAKSRGTIPAHLRGPDHMLFIDEFHNYADIGPTFTTMLSQTRKDGLHLGLSHQHWTDELEYIRRALENAGAEVIFTLGYSTAEKTVTNVARIDPTLLKHKVKDKDALDRTHPTYYSPQEQWTTHIQALQDLKARNFKFKQRGKHTVHGKSLYVPDPVLDPTELAAVNQEYLHRYFRYFPPRQVNTYTKPAADSNTGTSVEASVGYQSAVREVKLPAEEKVGGSWLDAFGTAKTLMLE